MKLELSHIAIAVPEIRIAMERLSALSLEIEESKPVPTERVNVGMIPVPVSSHFRLELLEPTDPESPIARFLAKKPQGGLHHICFEVEGIEQWETKLRAKGIEILPPGVRKAYRGRALFIHPKHMAGVLVELEELA